jgi:hypothetical protein
MIKPQDVAITLKLVSAKKAGITPTYADLATELKISASEAHAAVSRCLESGLLRRPVTECRAMPLPATKAIEELLVHGIKYIWPAKRGPVTRGMPTGTSLESVAQRLDVRPQTPGLVWPDPEGTVRGESIEPLYPRATQACKNDSFLYECLALIDVIRLRNGREATLAADAIRSLLP